jgi:hypothetical protein
MALEVEGDVDGGVDAEKPLRRAGRFEALHFPLPPPHDLVRVLDSIVHPRGCAPLDWFATPLASDREPEHRDEAALPGANPSTMLPRSGGAADRGLSGTPWHFADPG